MGVHNSDRRRTEVATRRNTLPQGNFEDPLNHYAVNRLHDLALRFVEHGFHEASRTHISFCLLVGKFGIRGVGTTARAAYAEYQICLRELLKSAEHPELAHWLIRFDSFATDGKYESATETVAARRASSGQIGMRLPFGIYEKLNSRATLGNRSWNEFVSENLDQEADSFDRAANKISANELTKDVDGVFERIGMSNVEQDSLKAWSQRVPKPLHTKLVSLAHEFGYPLSRFATYLLMKNQNQNDLHTKKQTQPG